MGVENHRVDRYQYEILQETIRNSTREMLLLFLYDEQKEMLCNIAFVPQSEEVLKAVPAAGGHVTAQLPFDHFDRVMDMLRNEKPVYFSWSPESQSIRLSTNKEPVGEQELRRLFSFLYI